MKAHLLPIVLGLATFLSLGAQEAPKGPEVGKPAPAFRVNDHTGRAVAIGGEAESWQVVAFFPKAATPG